MRDIPVSSTTVASTDMLNAFTGELLAIDVALAQLLFLSGQTQAQIYQDVTVFTDSQAALKALGGLTTHSGQFLAKKITIKVQKLNEKGILCKLQWSPGHAKIPGNMEAQAHRLAQLATRPEAVSPTFRKPILLYSLPKQRANTLLPGPDPKTLFGQAKVGRSAIY